MYTYIHTYQIQSYSYKMKPETNKNKEGPTKISERIILFRKLSIFISEYCKKIF